MAYKPPDGDVEWLSGSIKKEPQFVVAESSKGKQKYTLLDRITVST